MSRMILVRRKNTNCHLRGARSGGFTLIELSIVLVIIMSVLTLGMSALNSYMTSSAYSETKARQVRIKDALIAYFGANKRMPCPASGNPATTEAMRGFEAKDGAGVCNPDPTTPYFGIVPYRTLNLGRDDAQDGWGGFFSYQVYVDTTASACPPIQTGANWTIPSCFGAGKPGGINVVEGPDNPPTNPAVTIANGVVAIIISHGKNGFGAWTRQWKRNIDPATCEEAHNSLSPTLPSGCALTLNRYFKGEKEGNDDVVAYLTADDIIQPLAKQGAILSATAQVNDDLEKIRNQILSTPKAAGACSASITITLPKDPWGNSYMLNPSDGSSCSITIFGGIPTSTLNIFPADFCKYQHICPVP